MGGPETAHSSLALWTAVRRAEVDVGAHVVDGRDLVVAVVQRERQRVAAANPRNRWRVRVPGRVGGGREVDFPLVPHRERRGLPGFELGHGPDGLWLTRQLRYGRGGGAGTADQRRSPVKEEKRREAQRLRVVRHRDDGLDRDALTREWPLDGRGQRVCARLGRCGMAGRCESERSEAEDEDDEAQREDALGPLRDNPRHGSVLSTRER